MKKSEILSASPMSLTFQIFQNKSNLQQQRRKRVPSPQLLNQLSSIRLFFWHWQAKFIVKKMLIKQFSSIPSFTLTFTLRG